MLKHSDIIEKLNTLQKVALVSSALDGRPFEQVGLPPVKCAKLGELGRDGGVPYGSAVRSWNTDLIGKMTEELVLEAGKKGDSLFVTPDLKTAVNPREEGLSEDACLNGAMGAEMIRAAKSAGAAAGIARPSLGKDEIDYLDTAEDRGTVYELFIKPFINAVKDNPCDAVFLNPSREGTGYYDTNRSIFTEAQSGLFGKDVFIVGEGETFTADAVNLLGGRMTLGGSTIPLERAARRYAQLKGYEAEGSIPHRELEDSLRDGSAIDNEKLDGIVDEIIDFALTLDGLKIGKPIDMGATSVAPSEGDGQNGVAAETISSNIFSEEFVGGAVSKSSRRRAAAESFVLLKNSGILPMAAGTKVCVLGEAYGDLSFMREKFQVVGTAQGYDRAKARSDSLIPTAIRTAGEAQAVIVFLYPDETGRELALPANRLVLLEALKRTGKHIIAVVCGDLPVDLSFDRDLDAVLVAPDDGPFVGEALANILCGEENPSGKLVRTYYDFADKYYRAYRANRDAGRMRIGPFVGYRRYDIENVKVRYPFGYGLSYTNFRYSQLSIEGDSISFTLTNCGNFDGYEVAQVYIGVPAVTHVAPKKQLRAFRKVFLQKGQSKRVTISLTERDFATFDSSLYTDNVEAGDYIIYVGASALDIRLQGRKFMDGVSRAPVRSRANDFDPEGGNDDTGRIARGGRAKQKAKSAPDMLKVMHKTAVYALPLIALIFFLLLSVLILSYALNYVLLSFVAEETVEWSLFVLAVAFLALVPLLGSLNRKRLVRIRTLALLITPVLLAVCFVLGGILLSDNGGMAEEIALRVVSCFAIGTPILAFVAARIDRQLWRAKMGKNHWDKYYFEFEHDGKITSEAEFENAFRVAENAREVKAAEVKAEEPHIVAEVPQFYDKRLSYSQLIRDCRQFVVERGLNVSEETLRNYLGALSSTQLIFVPKGGGAELCEAVAEYFGRKAYIDNAEKYGRYEDMFAQWRQGGYSNVPTNLSNAIEAAGRETAYLHTVLIRHIDISLLESLFAPFADVLARRKTALIIGEKSLPLPANLVIVAEAEADVIENISENLAQVAAFISPACEAIEPAERKTILQTVGFERFSAMRQTVREDYPLDEELWKKVDALDERCRTARIGNQLWLKLEMHASVVYACGGEGEDALDGAMAVQLMHWLFAVWKNDICDGALYDVMTDIFGADKIKQCVAVNAAKDGEKK